MDPHRANILQNLLHYLQSLHVPLSELVLYALQQYNNPADPVLHDLIVNATSIAAALYYQPDTTIEVGPWIDRVACVRFGNAVRDLARKENGWHFNAAKTDPNQLRDFSLENMAAGMSRAAPALWGLIRSLLGFNEGDLPPVGAEVILDEEDADAEYWAGKDPPDAGTKRAQFVNIVRNMYIYGIGNN